MLLIHEPKMEDPFVDMEGSDDEDGDFDSAEEHEKWTAACEYCKIIAHHLLCNLDIVNKIDHMIWLCPCYPDHLHNTTHSFDIKYDACKSSLNLPGKGKIETISQGRTALLTQISAMYTDKEGRKFLIHEVCFRFLALIYKQHFRQYGEMYQWVLKMDKKHPTTKLVNETSTVESTSSDHPTQISSNSPSTTSPLLPDSFPMLP